MIEAKRAPVRPRVFTAQSNTPLVLEDEVRSIAETGARGGIAILGPAGSGKTTALRHLKAFLSPARRVTFLDEPKLSQLLEAMTTAYGLVIYTAQADRLANPLAAYWLMPWDRDDLIEYLLAVHRPRCAAVMARIRPADHHLLGGIAELWRIALDRLAAEDELPDVRRALHRHLQDHLADTDLLERARSACLNTVLAPEASLTDALLGLARPGFADSLIRLLRHSAMQVMLASERIAADLRGEAGCDFLAKRLPHVLVKATGLLLGGDERAREHLHALLAGPPWSHAMSVSLLHAAGASASLSSGCPSQLAGAYLNGVSWPGVKLMGADLTEADLSGADLRGADLSRAQAQKSNFREARLWAASLNDILVAEADWSGAKLSCVWGNNARFVATNVAKADFTSAQLQRAQFIDSDLSAAVFRDANLVNCTFSIANWKNADFAGADLTGAN